MDAIVVPGFDPQGAMTNPVRALGGITNTGSITPGTDYGVYATWLYAGVTGNIVFKKYDGTTQTLLNLAAGVFHPIHSVGIISAGTTATNLVWGN